MSEKIRNRVVGLRFVRAGDLIPNSRNWRLHPPEQRSAMQGILNEIGYADALLVRELPDGSLTLIDGHLRRETTPDQEVPVLVVDLTEKEADKLLAVLDPLAGMAEMDGPKIRELISGIETQDDNLRLLLSKLESQAIALSATPPDFQPADDSSRLDGRAPVTCPSCGHEFTP